MGKCIGLGINEYYKLYLLPSFRICLWKLLPLSRKLPLSRTLPLSRKLLPLSRKLPLKKFTVHGPYKMCHCQPFYTATFETYFIVELDGIALHGIGRLHCHPPCSKAQRDHIKNMDKKSHLNIEPHELAELTLTQEWVSCTMYILHSTIVRLCGCVGVYNNVCVCMCVCALDFNSNFNDP